MAGDPRTVAATLQRRRDLKYRRAAASEYYLNEAVRAVAPPTLVPEGQLQYYLKRPPKEKSPASAAAFVSYWTHEPQLRVELMILSQLQHRMSKFPSDAAENAPGIPSRFPTEAERLMAQAQATRPPMYWWVMPLVFVRATAVAFAFVQAVVVSAITTIYTASIEQFAIVGISEAFQALYTVVNVPDANAVGQNAPLITIGTAPPTPMFNP